MHYLGLRNKAPRRKTGRSFLPCAFSIHGGALSATWMWDSSLGSLSSRWAQGDSTPGFVWGYPGGKDQTLGNKLLLLYQFIYSWLCSTCTAYRVWGECWLLLMPAHPTRQKDCPFEEEGATAGGIHSLKVYKGQTALCVFYPASSAFPSLALLCLSASSPCSCYDVCTPSPSLLEPHWKQLEPLPLKTNMLIMV